jgi:hypothetical protein
MSKKPTDGYAIAHLIMCKNCISRKPESTPATTWQRLEVGLTSFGVQIWCHRCLLNVAHIAYGKCCVNSQADCTNENPTPAERQHTALGWKPCRKCGWTDQWGKGLFDQSLCLICGTEEEEYDDDNP